MRFYIKSLLRKNFTRNLLMSKEVIKLTGKVVECLPNATFRVELDNGHVISAHMSGKMRQFSIKIILHDKVDVEMSPYDLEKGRITYRHKPDSKRDKSSSETNATEEK